MEARDMVKKVIEATTASSNNKDQSEKLDIEPAERLLVALRKSWLDSWHYFNLVRGRDYEIDGLDEEEAMCLVQGRGCIDYFRLAL